MTKKRILQQQLEAESKGLFMALFKDWIVNPLENDFGFDFDVRITEPIDEKSSTVSDISFYVQLKSTLISKDQKVFEDLEIDHWKLYLGQRIPVLIVKYVKSTNLFYWDIAQSYLWDIIEKNDPNWKRNKKKRIILEKKIDNLDEVKDAIIDSQSRITRHHSLNLSLCEGISFNKDDLSNLSSIKNKYSDEIAAITLKESDLIYKSGDTKKSAQLLKEIYDSPKNDEIKIHAIISIIYSLNLSKPIDNHKILTLTDEAIKISQDLKIQYLQDYLTIIRGRANIYTYIRNISQILMGLKVQDVQKEYSFSHLYNNQFKELNKHLHKIINQINESMQSLLQSKDIYYYLVSLPLLVDTVAIQIWPLAKFDQEIIIKEKEGRKVFIDQCEFVLDNISDIEIQKILFKSLSGYYYQIKESRKAIKYMEKAITYANLDNDVLSVEKCNEILKIMKSNPNPYEISNFKKVSEMTTPEFQNLNSQLLNSQGINLDTNDDNTILVKIGLDDSNPEKYFKHCKKLHLRYVSTSSLGKSIGLNSLGSKFIWCKYCKNPHLGINLELIFNNFKEENCINCIYHEKRDYDWICMVKWVEEQENDAEFLKILAKYKNNF